MSASDPGVAPVVEVRPEVVFLYELLQELTQGRIRIPRFQRPFVWRRDQMTDLLDSVYQGYPIGSLLVWETDENIATLDRLGPFFFPQVSDGPVGYLLDGHQRLSTLAGALVATSDRDATGDDDPDRWNLAWNMESRRFEHYRADQLDERTLFPLTALLDTLRFFEALDRVRRSATESPGRAEQYVQEVSNVARSFQYYRVPVIRIRQTGLSEAVEIFARLNSKGLAMSADQMVSALMYRQDDEEGGFDLASEIDVLSEELGARNFADVDRTTILRAILAILDEDIYRTDWTRLTVERRGELLPRLRSAVPRTGESLNRAIDFLWDAGVKTSRVLPYTMQLVLLSAFFERRPNPSDEQREFLRRWFWVSSFSGWFGAANPSRVNSLVAEFRRRLVGDGAPHKLDNFDIDATSLPYPSAFDMRSARTRCLVLIMLSMRPQDADGTPIDEPWRSIAEKGPSAVGHVVSNLPRDLRGNPANRMLRPPGVERGTLRAWIETLADQRAWEVLQSHSVSEAAALALGNGDLTTFIAERQSALISHERRFQESVGVRPSGSLVGPAPIDTG